MLRKVVHRPVAVAISADRNSANVRMRTRRSAPEQNNGKGILVRLDSFSARNFVSRVRPRREEILQLIRICVLPRGITEHHDPGFMVLGLPCVQKAIRRSQRRAVEWINFCMTRNFPYVSERRRAHRTANCNHDHPVLHALNLRRNGRAREETIKIPGRNCIAQEMSFARRNAALAATPPITMVCNALRSA